MKSDKNTLQVTVLVLDTANMLSLAAAVDPMRAANRLAGRALFHWQFATPGPQPVRLTSGLELPAAPLARVTRCDLLMVIASFDLDPQDTPVLRAGLRRLAAQGATLVGLDGGPWLIAAAGLLDGHRATTHWEDLEHFASRFPGVDARPDRFVMDGARLTSGGALPGLDMMLALIGDRFGAALATRVAGVFIHDSPQDPARAQRRAAAHPGHNRITAKASAQMEQTLEQPLPLSRIAAYVGLSPRGLQAQFRKQLQTTPQAHYLQLRLSEAHRLVTDSDLPLQEVALATGFASQSSFARAFRAAFGQAARDLRRARAVSMASDGRDAPP